MAEVWMVNQYAISPDLPGGTRHYDFGRELVKAGHTVKLFISNVNLALRQEVRQMDGHICKEEIIDEVSFEWIKTMDYKKNDWRRALNMVDFSVNLYRAGIKQNSKPDVIIGSSPNLFAAFAAGKLADRLDARFFFEVRDLWPQALIDMGVNPWHPLVLLFRQIERYLYKKAEYIIVLAEGSIDYLQERGVPRGKILFIPNGVHLEHFKGSAAKDELRAKYGFKKFTLVYTGAHGPANSLDTIVDAADHLKNDNNVEFILVGDGPSKPHLVQRAKELSLPNLRFINPVPKQEIPNLLLAADAAIITLQNVKAFSYAISPNKLFDYMAAEKPIICSVPGHIANMVKDVGCGIVSPSEDGYRLASSVEQLMTLPEHVRAEMGTRGRKVIADSFSRAKLAEKLIRAIEKQLP